MMNPPSPPAALADLWFVDVGQGDCTVVIDWNTRHAVLIDCPSGQRIIQKVKDLLQSAQITLFAAIVTHWDIDHYGGIARISQYARPTHVYYNHDTLFTDKPGYGKYIKTTLQSFLDLTKFGTELHCYRYRDELHLGSISIRFLAPTQEEVTRAYLASKRNVASAVVVIDVDSLRALVGGDAVASTWERLLGSSEDLSAFILRWPHHGALLHGGDSALVDKVLDAVRPERIVISTGFGNPHLHPSREVVSLGAKRSYVCCTQVTGHCFGFSTKEEQSAPGARAILEAVSPPTCAGTIKVSVGPAGAVAIEPSTSVHQARIGIWPVPMCASGPVGTAMTGTGKLP